ncbi:MAG: MlaE family ABC transporter permease, partial [Planctomycetota bacterium]
ENGGQVEIVGAGGRVARMLELYGSHAPKASHKEIPAPIGTIEQIGRSTVELGRTFREVFRYLGALACALVGAVRHPGSVNWRDVIRLAEKTGADALPIVGMISFLTGVILAYEGATQLAELGATAFVPDLVAFSVTRELGPLLTAIIIAGRSGAAFAAEIGTMKVNEEIDALYTFGLNPYGFLVLPRVLALVLVLPMLNIFADLVGLAGGLVVSIVALDSTTVAFLQEVQNSIQFRDVGAGLLKSLAFGAAIAMISCERGLATRGGPEGVGKSTTSAVVASIFQLIFLDAAFTYLLTVFGI